MNAIISPDGKYRYTLTREWGPGPTCVFVMLNPSTADATQDDPTIRRCIGFAKREGCGRLLVVNLFAYRATKPSDLPLAGAVGPDNDQHLQWALRTPDAKVIVAWGAHQDAAPRAARVRQYAVERRIRLWCLGTTKSGAPRHPLYVRSDRELHRWA